MTTKVEDNGTITETAYCGPFVYDASGSTLSLKYIVTPEGRVVKNGSTWDFEYKLTDHLGNTRAVIHKSSNGLAEVIQEWHYYPFGMEMSGLTAGTSSNKYLYNGKELQTDFNLDWYDYGARFYDPALARWHSVDPMAEKYYHYGSYNYTLNNPMRFIDPDGMQVFSYFGSDDEAMKQPEGLSVSSWIKSIANSLGFNMKSIGSANSTIEMDQVAAHNAQQCANLEQTESNVKSATAVVATVIATPLALGAAPAPTTGAIIATDGAALKGAISVGVQLIANDGKIDPLTVVTDAILTPGAGNLLDAAFDVNASPNTGVSVDIVGINKTPERAGLDFVVGYGFGKANNKATGVMLRNSETKAQEYFYKSIIGTTSGVTGSKIKQ